MARQLPLHLALMALTWANHPNHPESSGFADLWMVSAIAGLRPNRPNPGPLVAADRTGTHSVTIHNLGTNL